MTETSSSVSGARRQAWPFWCAVLLLTGLYATTFTISEGQQERLTGTRLANVELAYNLHHHGTFSRSPATPRAPSAYRPPGYPAFLSMGMLVVPGLRHQDLQYIGFHASKVLSPLYAIQKLTLLLVAYLAMAAVWLTTRNRWLCLLPLPFICHTPLVLAGYHSTLNEYANLFYPTPLSTLLVTALGLCLWATFEKQTTWQFALTGLLAGTLALTRAAFQYYILLGALVLVVWVWRRPERRRWLTLRVACCIGVSLVVIFGWMARNQTQLGRFFIAERGGYQLDVRAQMLDMDRTTYLASFLYWTNSRLLHKTVLKRLIGEQRFAEVDSKLNSGSVTSFKRSAKNRWREYQARHASSVVADRLLLDDAVDSIRKRPIRHLLISIPLLHRGICVERPYGLNWLLWAAFFGVGGMALVRRQSGLLAMLTPALFCLGFNTAFTNNLPRYNVLLIPTLWVTVAIALHQGIDLLRARRSAPPARTKAG